MSTRLVIVFCLLLLAPELWAGSNIISPTVAHTKWLDREYTIQGTTLRMEDNVTAVGVSYRFLFDSGLAVGGDFLYSVDQDFRAASGGYTGYSTFWHLLANVSYTFNRQGQLQPFVEGGLGYSTLSLHSNGGPNASLEGLNLHGGAGLNYYVSDVIGFKFGAKVIDFDVRDGNGGRIDGRIAEYLFALNIRF